MGAGNKKKIKSETSRSVLLSVLETMQKKIKSETSRSVLLSVLGKPMQSSRKHAGRCCCRCWKANAIKSEYRSVPLTSPGLLIVTFGYENVNSKGHIFVFGMKIFFDRGTYSILTYETAKLSRMYTNQQGKRERQRFYIKVHSNTTFRSSFITALGSTACVAATGKFHTGA
jgi:hypothetical protein